eukprot:TRINITY_DN1718_c0_g1_i1.p3 TRINITY_DN1718_c0_g1~~TRINITY_DN1718_c0_g1_i1.p3  ORF type:complete len:176 (-),score=15.40 TRINITY_DN1718_c0_g1_i1:7102-7560(-)
MRALLVLAAFVAVVTATPLKITWRDCGAPNGKVTNVTITPENPTTGSNITISAVGRVSVPVNSGTFSLAVKDVFPIYSTSGAVCPPEHISLPLSAGDIWYPGLNCPVAPGTVSTGLTILLKAFPGGTVTAQLTAANEKSEGVICVTAFVTAA